MAPPSDLLMVALVVIVYLALRMLVNSRFGNVMVAIRENEQRAELLGYDVRKYRLATFCIGSALAGLSGALVYGVGTVHHASKHRAAGGGHADRVGILLGAA